MSSLGAFTLRSAARVNSALLVSRVSPRICVPLRAATTLNDGASKTHDHSAHFKVDVPSLFSKNRLFLTSRVYTIQISLLYTTCIWNCCLFKTHVFQFERYFAAGMMPLIPAAYFVHGPVMDAALTIALTLHIHWYVLFR